MSKLPSRLLLAVLVLVSGCAGGSSTETGNPNLPGDPGGSGGGTTRVAAAQVILDNICIKLTECFGSLSPSQCEAGVLPQTNLAARLGLPAGFGSAQAILDAEAAKTINGHAPARDQCVADLSALSCSGSVVQGAYSAATPGDFSHVAGMLATASTSCAGTY